ncbi:hypothetical protein MXD81_56645 [Microbacteriaceae bacterium K1510]|nr:hypothetical protein [Microbacteriaceae bacterium K1510]
MTHKFPVGATVYYESGIAGGAARGVYKIMRQLPVERDDRRMYRIKSIAETFERTAEESQLARAS